jgi:hypothetical protein
MVRPGNHQRLMDALADAVSGHEPLPSRLALARAAGVSTATMNRDSIFLDAYARQVTSAQQVTAAKAPKERRDAMIRLRQENTQQAAAIRLLVDAVQVLTEENEALRRELRRRAGQNPEPRPTSGKRDVSPMRRPRRPAG